MTISMQILVNTEMLTTWLVKPSGRKSSPAMASTNLLSFRKCVLCLHQTSSTGEQKYVHFGGVQTGSKTPPKWTVCTLRTIEESVFGHAKCLSLFIISNILRPSVWTAFLTGLTFCIYCYLVLFQNMHERHCANTNQSIQQTVINLFVKTKKFVTHPILLKFCTYKK